MKQFLRILVSVFFLSSPAWAQWNTLPNHAMGASRGAGVSTPNPVGPCLSGVPVVGGASGLTSDPICSAGGALGTFAFQNYATPPAIGGTTPNTGAFSALTLTTPLGLAYGGLGGSQAAATVGQFPVFPGSGGAAVPTALTAVPTDLTLGSVVFAGASGMLSQNNNTFFWDNANSALGIGLNNPNGLTAGVGLGIVGRFILAGPISTSISQTPSLFLVQGGSVGTPQSAYSPMAAYSQVSQVTTTGGDASEQATVQINLNADSHPSVVGATSQAVGVAVKATMAATGKADIAPGYFFGTNNSTEICEPLCRVAFSIFGGASGQGPHTSAITAQLGVWNGNGADRPFLSSYTGGETIMTSVDAYYQASSGSWLGGAAFQARATPASGQWDTIIGVTNLAAKNSVVRDYSNAVAGWEDHGAHTYGWNGLGATYSDSAFVSPGFKVGGDGNVSLSNATASQIVVSSGSHGLLLYMSAAGATLFGTVTAAPLAFITNNTFRGFISNSAADLSLGSSGNRGALILFGATSGSATIIPPATGGGSLTLPAGTGTVSLTEQSPFAINSYTNSLSAAATLNNSTFVDGPSAGPGTSFSGKWFASGTVSLNYSGGAALIACQLWDGTTVIASVGSVVPAANTPAIAALSGVITSPAANIRISCKNLSANGGTIYSNNSGIGNTDATVTAIRIN